jgi:hypothetical protein
VITANKGFDREQMWPIGEGRRLNTTLRGVERDAKTVAWDVFSRVNRPDRPYYLDTYGTWKGVPGCYYTRRPGGDVSRKKRAEP